MTEKKPLGAGFWKSLAGRRSGGLGETFQGALICPDDDAALEPRDEGRAFICPGCNRRFEVGADGALDILPVGDPYQLSPAQVRALEESASANRRIDDPAAHFGGIWETMLALLGSLEGKKGLDACCGTGWGAAALAAAGASMAAVDIVAGEGGLATAAEVVRGRGVAVDRFQADVVRLPFAPQTFDFVYVAAALHTLPRPERLTMEIERVLKPGGMLVNLDEPIAESSVRGIGAGDPRRSGRQLALKDYEGIYKQAGLAMHVLFPGDKTLPEPGFAGTFRRSHRAHDGQEARLLVGVRPGGLRMPVLKIPFWSRRNGDE